MVSAARILRLPLFLLLSFGSCRFLFVGDSRVTSVFVTPANPTIAVGATQQFIAHVTRKDGFTTQTTAALWSTSDPRVATIGGRGLATGIGAGTSTITATVDSVSGSTSLTVKVSALNAVAVRGGAGKLEITFPETAQRFLYVVNALEDTIAVYRLGAYTGADPATASEHLVATVAVYPGRGPAWLALHPTGRFLYVLNRVSNDTSAFTIEAATGALQPVVGSPFACEGNAWTLAVDAAGERVEVTDIKSSEVARYHIDQFTGALALLAESP